MKYWVNAKLLLILALIGTLITASMVQAAPGGPPSNAACDTAVLDNKVLWDGITYNSRDINYKSPYGAVPHNQDATFRIQTCAGDVSEIKIRWWNATHQHRELYTHVGCENGKQSGLLGRNIKGAWDSYSRVLYIPHNGWYRHGYVLR
ncbi:hypothetical protein [Cohnella sp.]|uniref:hypothetical protein n=1 Tax=Cohnella sp. TaxID=1883426 RepID=UPI0035661CA6